MNIKHYEYFVAPNHLDYEFYSDGPKGKVKKRVRFTLAFSNGIPYYNLGFGDWNEDKLRIDDLVVTNNEDAERVLATVALTVVDFTDNFPDALVYIEGSTPSRTRRYQMGINKFRTEIEADFEIFGLFKDFGWEEFEPEKNYVAFIGKRKINTFTPQRKEI